MTQAVLATPLPLPRADLGRRQRAADLHHAARTPSPCSTAPHTPAARRGCSSTPSAMPSRSRTCGRSPARLSLDHEGFELLPPRDRGADLYDDDAVEQVYYPEIEALLRAVTGASRVVIFDATRRSDGGAGAKNRDGLRGPASRVHVDYTAKSGPQRVKDLLGEAEAARLAASGARIIQINVWRPIRGPVQRSPLALADASSVRARGSDRDRPGVPRPGRRDLPPRLRPGAALVLRAAR